MRILLVDDDRALIEILTKTLAEKNYALDVATDGEQGWVYGSTYTYDLIILDWSLPKLDGISLCQRFRTHGYSTPIMLLTSRHGSQNKIRGLDAGADDYLCKPFDVEELAARIRALLRRLSCDFLPILSWGDLQLDPCSCQVTYQGRELSLAAKEYCLLELLLRRDREVVTIKDIIESLWSSIEYPAEATVRSHIRRLRDKLELAGLPKDIIATVRGQGYCLKPLAQNNSITEKPLIPKPASAEQSLEGNTKERNTKHLAALNAIWEKHKPKREQQLATLKQAIAFIQTDNLGIGDRLTAIVAAHSLAGNLGQFGFDRASQLAREIEQILQNNPHQPQWQELAGKLTHLIAEMTEDSEIIAKLNHKIDRDEPLLLIIGEELDSISELIEIAVAQGIATKILANPELVTAWLEKRQVNRNSLPQTVLLNLDFNDRRLSQAYLTLIAEFNLLVPSIPVIVMANSDRFEDRLQVARHGGSFFLTQPIHPSQIITFCQQAIQSASFGKKIMIVDDDLEILQILPILLEPWGFQLTTLNDPRQFWDLLQVVNPDLLVLDIDMPHLSGIELCKVLRTHNYWRKLPVLFLSVHTDVMISHQAFASGANDFVNKPVIAQKLAHRIIHHLNFNSYKT
jgi:DNA-binding response OmpR family regulator